MRRYHAGKGLFSLGASCTFPEPWRASVRMGLANAAITGQRANGFRRLFKTGTSRILKVFGIIREKSMDKAPSLGVAGESLGLLYRGYV